MVTVRETGFDEGVKVLARQRVVQRETADDLIHNGHLLRDTPSVDSLEQGFASSVILDEEVNPVAVVAVPVYLHRLATYPYRLVLEHGFHTRRAAGEECACDVVIEAQPG